MGVNKVPNEGPLKEGLIFGDEVKQLREEARALLFTGGECCSLAAGGCQGMYLGLLRPTKELRRKLTQVLRHDIPEVPLQLHQDIGP